MADFKLSDTASVYLQLKVQELFEEAVDLAYDSGTCGDGIYRITEEEPQQVERLTAECLRLVSEVFEKDQRDQEERSHVNS